MRKLAKFAAAAVVALPLMGFAATGTAQAADVSFSVSVGDDGRYVHYDRSTYGYRYGRNWVLPGYVVRSYLQRDFDRVSRLDRRGDVYVARALDWRGRDVRIVASAYTGQVIDVDYVRWNGREWRAWARWNDWRDGRGWKDRDHHDRRDSDRHDRRDDRDWNDRRDDRDRNDRHDGYRPGDGR
jgi:hypothetical protein